LTFEELNPMLGQVKGPINSRIVDLLTALQRVYRQITHPALGQQHQLIFAQVCMAAAPCYRTSPRLTWAKSPGRLAFSSGPAGNGTAWLAT
jgi:hypothetical protein